MFKLLFSIVIFLSLFGNVYSQGLPVGKVYKKPVTLEYKQKVTYVRSNYPGWNLSNNLRSKTALIGHIMDEHSVQIPKEINLYELTYEDLYRLHAIIHAVNDGRMVNPGRLGYWTKNNNVYTFIWEL